MTHTLSIKVSVPRYVNAGVVDMVLSRWIY